MDMVRLAGEEDVGDISREALRSLPFSLCITNPHLDDNPIVYVNQNFERTTGYSREAAIGRNCRFLQGPETDAATVEQIRKALGKGEEIVTDILNYRADGTPFLNRLYLSPLRGDDGEISHYLGLQTLSHTDGRGGERAERLDRSLREIQHRVKNHLQLLLALIRLEARRSPDSEKPLDQLASRVEALNLLYDEFSRSGDDGETVGLGAYVSRVASALNMLDGQRRIIMNIDAEPIQAALDAASVVGLMLSEFITNSLQHGFDEDQQGIIEVGLAPQGKRHFRLTVEDDGNGIPSDTNWPKEGNLGARIVTDLVRQLKGELGVHSGSAGTLVTVDIPITSLKR